MAVTIFKAKSLKKDAFTDKDIENKCGEVTFISFESLIRDFHKHYGLTKEPIGYRVTEQGIEMIY